MFFVCFEFGIMVLFHFELYAAISILLQLKSFSFCFVFLDIQETIWQKID